MPKKLCDLAFVAYLTFKMPSKFRFDLVRPMKFGDVQKYKFYKKICSSTPSAIHLRFKYFCWFSQNLLVTLRFFFSKVVLTLKIYLRYCYDFELRGYKSAKKYPNNNNKLFDLTARESMLIVQLSATINLQK